MTRTETLLNALLAGIHSAPAFALIIWGAALFSVLIASYKSMTGQAFTVAKYHEGWAILAKQQAEARARGERQSQVLASRTAAATDASDALKQEGGAK